MNVTSIEDQVEPLFHWYEEHAATLGSDDEWKLLTGIDFVRTSGTLIPTAIEDLQNYHALYGLAMFEGQTSIATTENGNGLGGPGIPSRKTTAISDFADAGGCVVFEIEAKADPTRAAAILAATLEDFGVQQGLEDDVRDLVREAEELGSDFSSESLTLYQWDPTVGWFVSIGTQELTSVGGHTTRRTETIVVDR